MVSKFPFPPNGKARVNLEGLYADTVIIFTQVSIPSEREGTCKQFQPGGSQWLLKSLVSIPSEREGTCKHDVFTEFLDLADLFRFPPNGKARVNPKESVKVAVEISFQFPPNGKARVNDAAKTTRQRSDKQVSIPSEREGTCKHQ